MDRNQAIKVLSTMAQGMDPATGEHFPEESPYHRVDIIRTLFYAAESLRNDGQTVRSIEMMPPVAEPLQKQASPVHDRKKAEPIELTGSQMELFETLRKWRFEQAHTEGIFTYMVLSNETLSRIASVLPNSTEELSRIKGFGDIKLLKYSELILNMINDFKQTYHEGNSMDDPLCKFTAKVS